MTREIQVSIISRSTNMCEMSLSQRLSRKVIKSPPLLLFRKIYNLKDKKNRVIFNNLQQ